jgi:hypothetical protein
MSEEGNAMNLTRRQALRFTRDASGLSASAPREKPPTGDLGITLRINFA